jgi:ribosomal RNA assembly protein
MEEYSYELKIPHERVAVLIGKDGKVKKELETLTKTTLQIDSKEGDVFVRGTDPIGLYTMKEIVQAVGRGFNPDVTLQLVKPDYCLEVISIHDYGKTKSDIIRLKGRLIGADGKCRRLIEELSDVHMCVYGKTVSLLGQAASVAVARKALDLLLRGSPHSKVYHWLERQRRNLRAPDL